MPQVTPANLVKHLVATKGQSKAWVERKIAEVSLGVVAALRDGSLPIDAAWDELFNLENRDAIVQARLSKDLKELIEWGMELGTVARVAPESLNESFEAMSKLATRVISGPYRRKTRRSIRAKTLPGR
jgi:hypothetical protein